MKDETPYGFCPICGAPGLSRERRPNGNDHCAKGCTYPSKDAVRASDYIPPVNVQIEDLKTQLKEAWKEIEQLKKELCIKFPILDIKPKLDRSGRYNWFGAGEDE